VEHHEAVAALAPNPDPDGVTADFEDLRSILSLYNRGRLGPRACKG